MNASLIKEIEEKMQENKLDLVKLFLAAKRVEGCSEKTVKYYDSTIRNARAHGTRFCI